MDGQAVQGPSKTLSDVLHLAEGAEEERMRAEQF